MMLQRRVDGMIFGDAHIGDGFLDSIAARGVPFTLVSRRVGDHVSATCDDLLGGRLVGEHLVASGRRRLGVLAGLQFASTAQDRTSGAVAAFRAAGLDVPDERIVWGQFDAAGGRRAAEQLLAPGRSPTRSSPPTTSPPSARSGRCATAACASGRRRRGRRLQRHPAGRGVPVALTTVRSPMHGMGVRGVELLVRLLAGEQVSSERLVPELQVRASSGCVAPR